MVAVVSGSGLGLFGATVGAGAAGVGQGRDRIYVNSTTGNLILQSQDEQLRSVGLDLSLTRTYNSQGLMDDDNGDQWRLSAQQRLSSVSGTLNAAGSSLSLTLGDGRAVVYRYDVARALYVSTEGPDAHDTLSHAGGQWTWTDESNRNTLSFDATGRLTAAKDRDGNTVSYGYSGELLSSITDASGQVTTLEYHAGTRDLARIRVTPNNQTQVLTSYFYDSAHRLARVQVDLTPENGSDTVFFDTTYTYEGASTRIVSLTQADGAAVSFTYEQGLDGQHRVKSYTEGTGAAARTTRFSYETGSAGSSGGADAPDPFGATVLTSFVPVKEVSVAPGEWRYYAITVPEGAGELSITSRFGSGDADLYVRRGALPTLDTFEVKADASAGNDEVAYLQNPTAGVWYVGVHGFAAVAGLELEAHTQSTAEQVLTPGEVVTQISGAPDSVRLFRFEVPAGTQRIRVALSGPNGDAGLYLMENAPVSLSDPDYYSEGGTTDEVIVPDTSTPGTWYVLVKGYTSFSDAQLVVHLNLPPEASPPVLQPLEVRSVSGGAEVALRAQASGAGPLDYEWSQVGGPAGDLLAADDQAVFYAPSPVTDSIVRLRVRVTDAQGISTTSFVEIRVAGGAAATPPAPDSTTTRITDALGHVITRVHDAQGRLLSEQGPVSRTDYTYDAEGNLTALIEDAGGVAPRITVFEYDSRGNRIYSRSHVGETVRSTYSANNQRLTETRYRVADLDGAGPAQPSEPETTRYVYDAEDHLRFTVSAEGRVSELHYRSDGLLTQGRTFLTGRYDVSALSPEASLSEAQLMAWVSGQADAKIERTEYGYDFRGELSSLTQYTTALANAAPAAGTARTTLFVRDARGRLLQSVDARGTTVDAGNANIPYATTYTYDGLGRGLTTTQWVSAGVLRTTSTQYDDAGYRIVTTLANGLVKTATFDTASQLVSEASSSGATALGTVSYRYDAAGRLRQVIDANGLTERHLYDEAGRKVALVSGGGSLTEFVYDHFDQVVKTVRYADRLTSEQLASLTVNGQPSTVTLATLKSSLPATIGRASDQIEHTVYDAAGRVQFTVDASGAVTQLFYDGTGRVTDTVQFATRVAIAPSVEGLRAQDVAIVESAEDRHTRTLYDLGRVRAQLDAAGSLLESLYDGAGRLTQQIAYANATPLSARANGTLDELRPAADEETSVDAERDQRSYFFYDALGQQLGSVDAEGSLSETLYGLAGEVIEQRRYDQVLTVTPTSTFESVQAQLSTSSPVRSTRFAYDGVGQLVQQTDYAGTVATFTYDAAGQRTASMLAHGTLEARTTQVRYDLLGRITHELSGAGAALLATASPDQLESIWERYAVRYDHDTGGRRIRASSRPDDQTERTTWYFYDAEDRLRVEVSSLGEVTENLYNALGELTERKAYTNRISTAGLSGGALTPELMSLLSAASDAAHDARTQFSYTLTGQIASTLNAAGQLTTSSYNAFGELAREVSQIDAARNLITELSYDLRGLLIRSLRDSEGLALTTQQSFDAFGRLTSLTDARGNTTHTQYDRLGREVLIRDAGSAERSSTYDAFSRVRTTRDALGHVTRYAYDDATRSTTVTTPEGIAVTTVLNRHGQTLTLTAADNTTRYEYDANGNLKSTSDHLGTLETRTYDRGGRQLTTTDARGTLTRFSYDAAHRVLSRSVDAEGLALTTSYVYDGQGRIVRTTEPGNRVTQTLYTADGELAEVILDPQGLHLRTTYTYDASGNVLTVIEGAGSPHPQVTEYRYNVLGWRTQEILDPGAGKLNLTTQFKHDAHGNVTRRIDARGFSTWYVYDAHDQLIQSIDATGALTQTTYDAEGRVSAVREFANALSAATLAALGDVTGAVSAPASANDRLTQSFYDADGREAFSIASNGAVIERSFDANGNVTRTRQYAKAIPAGQHTTISALNAALTAAGNSLTTPAAEDRLEWTAHDARGQSVFTVDAAGAVARLERDAAGQVTSSTAFATARALTLPMDLANLTAWANQASVANPADPRVERFWHDAAGRQVFKLDAAGYLQQTLHDDATRTTRTISYRDRVSVGATVSLAQLQTHSVVTGFNAAYDRVSTAEIDPAGRVIKVYDALQARDAVAVERFEYDATGHRITSIDARGHATRRTFDAAGRELTVTDALGGVTTQTYNATGQRLKLTDARGVSGYTFYDARGEAVYQIDPGGYVSRLTRDVFGNVIEEIAFANALTGAYDENTRIQDLASRITVDAVRDRKLTRVFEARGLVESVTHHNTTNHTLHYTEAFKYNTFGEQIESQNRNGAVTNYTYSTRGERVSVLGPAVEVVTALFPTPTTQTLRLQTLYEYSAFGEVTLVREAAGTAQERQTRTLYDPRGLGVRIQGPAFEVYDRASNTSSLRTPETLKTYDAAGNLITEVAPNGARTVHYYNVRNQLIASVSPDGVLSELDRDAVGNEIATRIFGTRLTGPLDVNVKPTPVNAEDYRELKYQLDANHRRIKTETRAETLYSIARAAAAGDGYYFASVITLASYDANGNLTQTTDGNGHGVRHYYDGVGNKVLSVDEAGYVTHWQYNAQGQVTRESRLAGKLNRDFHTALTPTSAAAAILAAVPAGENRVTELKYDALGRQIEERKLAVTYTRVDPNSGVPIAVTADVVSASAYDGNGNLTAQVRADGGCFDFTYDALDRKTAQLDPEFQAFMARGEALATVRSQQLIQYDAHGNAAVELALGASAAENRQVLQRFDTAGNLRERREPGGASFTYDYDVSGNTLRTTRAVRDVDGVLHQYRTYARFDALDREISRQDIADQFTPTQVVRETQDVRYNAYGDIEAKGIHGQFQEQFIYDRLGRLFRTHENGAPTLFVYDANGNAVLEIKGLTTEVTQVLEGGVLRPIRGPQDAQSLLPTREQITTSFYDERNLLITVADAPMSFGTLLASQPYIDGQRPAVVEQLRGALASIPTSLNLTNPINGSLANDASHEVARNHGNPESSFGTPNPQSPTRVAYIDPRTRVPPNFGVVADPEVSTTPEVTILSNHYDEARGERTVVERITRTLIRTEVKTEDTDGNGAHDTVIKTITTENPVVTRTTLFKREGSETPAEDEQSIRGELEVMRTETTQTTGTVNIFVEKTTRSLMTERVSTYTYSSTVQGVVNLLAAVPLTINVQSVPVDPQQQPELDSEVDIGVFLNSPAIAGFGTDNPVVSAQIAAHGAITQQSSTSAVSFQASRRGTLGEGAHIAVKKGGYTLFSDYVFEGRQTVQLGPFLSLKEVPPELTVALVLIQDDGSKTAPLASIYNGAGGGPRELVFAEPYPGAFTASRRYEYTLRGSEGAIRNVIGGRIDGSERGAAVTTQTNTFTLQEKKNTSNVNGSLDQPGGAPPSAEQQTYLLNLIRAITEGTPSEFVIKRDQTYNAFREVVTQIDGREKTTELYYDKLGNLVRQVQPKTLIDPQAGAAFEGRPTTYYLYNQLSEWVGTQDANSVAGAAGAPYYSTRVLVNGRVEKQFNAAGALTRHVYDSLGNERQQLDALGQETAYTYDLAGRLLRQDRYLSDGVLHSYDRYQYDAAGNRTEHTHALGDTERYLFDDQNRITRYSSFAGHETRYDYRYLSDLAGIGGYEKLTTTAGLNGTDTQIERTDIFGNLRYTRDLGGHEYLYEYNPAGLLSRQTGTTGATGRAAQDIRYHYFLNGLIQSIDDLGISAYSKFQYDHNGNRISEIYSRVAIVAGLQDVHPYQVAYAEYDELNRLVRASEAGRFDIRYTYDAVGNRRSLKSDYFDLLKETEQSQAFYYKYDKLNRFTVTLGQKDATGQIISGTTGYDITYDALDRRTSATSRLLNKTTSMQEYVREEYQYDRIGTVKRVDIYNAAHARVGGSTRDNNPVGSLREYVQFKVEGGTEVETRKTNYDYDRDQRIRHEITVNNRDNAKRDRTDYHYEGEGILTSTLASTIDQNGNTIVSAGSVTTRYAYEKWDNYKESAVTATVQGPRDWRMGTSLYTYDSNGHIAKLFDVQASRTLEYVNNQNGQVLKRYQIDREADGSDKPPEIRNFYYLNGRGIGDTGTDRVESRVDYAQQLAEQEKKDKKGRTSQINPQLTQRLSPVTSADFDQSFQPINEGFPARVAGTHIVQPNESLQSIAAATYGDSSLWYLIAEANGLTGNDQLVAGLRLRVPNVVANVRNHADTFRPYDVEAALGKTDPTLPPPPPPPAGKKGCGTVGIILVAAVAIIATIATAGAAATLIAGAANVSGGILATGLAATTGTLAITGTGTVVTAAISIGAAGIGGAVGSIAGQLVGIAAGLQDGFDFKGVARGAIGAGIGAAVGGTLSDPLKSFGGVFGKAGTNVYTQAALRGATSSVLTQSFSREGFSWRNVAIAAVSAPVAAAVGTGVGEIAGNIGLADGLSAFVSNFSSGISSGVVGRALGNGQSTKGILANALGNAIGDTAISQVSLPKEFKQLSPEQKRQVRRLANRIGADINDPRSAGVLIRATEAQSGTALSTGELRSRTVDLLQLAGASDEQVDGVLSLYKENGLLLGGQVEITEEGFAAASTPRKSAFGSTLIDEATIGTGRVLEKIGGIVGEIESNPIAKYALVGIEVASGPVAYVANKALESVAGDVIGNAQDAAANFLAGKLDGAGYSPEDASTGGAGAIGLLGIIGGGAVAALKGAVGLIRRLQASRRDRFDTERLRRQQEIDLNFYKDSFDVPYKQKPYRPDFLATSNGGVVDVRKLTDKDLKALARELKIAELTGGTLAKQVRVVNGKQILEDTPIKMKGQIVSAIDVYGKNGELIQVGGISKGGNPKLLERTKRSLTYLKDEAQRRGTVAKVYFEVATGPDFDRLIGESQAILGKENVFTFKN